ncbi:MAG: hypothetical protein JRC99_04630, partial [Deltaproteobacteria bacterium]|nr:hypothetical protein [Deltaproteobacteria bacterium]
MELRDPIVIGSKHALTLAYAHPIGGEVPGAATSGAFLVVVDEFTGVGIALSRELLCTPEDVEDLVQNRCEVLNAGDREEVVVSVAGGRTDIEILKRIQPRSSEEEDAYDGLDSSPVLLVAPTIRVTSDAIESDLNLVLVADTIQGRETSAADFAFVARTVTERYFWPRNGATFAVMDAHSSGYGGCSMANLSAQRIPIENLPNGTCVCARTSDGRICEFRIEDTIGPSPGQLDISYTTWKRMDTECEPPPLHSRGRFIVHQTWSGDLDTGTEAGHPSAAEGTTITVKSPVFKEVFEGRPDTERTIPSDWPQWRQDLAYVAAPGLLALAGREIDGIQHVKALPDMSRYRRYSKVVFRPSTSGPSVSTDSAGQILYVDPYRQLIEWADSTLNVWYWRPPHPPNAGMCTNARYEARKLKLDVWLPRVGEAMIGGVATITCGGTPQCQTIQRESLGREKTELDFEGGTESFAETLIQMVEERMEPSSSTYEWWPCEKVNYDDVAVDEDGDGVPDEPFFDCICPGYISVEICIRDSDGDEQICKSGRYGSLAAVKAWLKDVLQRWEERVQTRGLSSSRPIAPFFNGYTRLYNNLRGNGTHQAVLSRGEIIEQMYHQADQRSRRDGAIKGWDTPYGVVSDLPGYHPKPAAGTCDDTTELPEACQRWEAFLGYTERLFDVDGNELANIDRKAAYLRRLGVDAEGTLIMHDEDSYDFSEQTAGQVSGGDFYLKDLKFYANNVGQRGIVDLGDTGQISLDQVDAPASGYTRFGVPAVADHTYVSLAQEGEEGNVIVFRVHGIKGSTVTFEYRYRTDPDRGIFVNAIDQQYGHVARGWYQNRDQERIFGATARDGTPPSFASYQEKWENAREWATRVQAAACDLEQFSEDATQVAVNRLIERARRTAEELSGAAERNLLSKEQAAALLQSTITDLARLHVDFIETLESAWNCGYIAEEARFDCSLSHRPAPYRDSIVDEFEPCEDYLGIKIIDAVEEVGDVVKKIGSGLKAASVVTGKAELAAAGAVLKEIGSDISALGEVLEFLSSAERCEEADRDYLELLRTQMVLANQLRKSMRINVAMGLATLGSVRGDIDYYQSSSELLRELAGELEDMEKEYADAIAAGIEDWRTKLALLCPLSVEAIHAAQEDMYTVNQILQTTQGYPFLTSHFEIPPSLGYNADEDKPEYGPVRRYGFGISLWDERLGDWYFTSPEDRGGEPRLPSPGDTSVPVFKRQEQLDWSTVVRRLRTRTLRSPEDRLLYDDLFARIGEVGEEYFSNYRTLADSLFVVRKRLHRSSCQKRVVDGKEFFDCAPPEPAAYCDEVDAFLANGAVRFEVDLDDLLRATDSDIIQALQHYDYIFRSPPVVHKAYYQVYHAGCRYDELTGRQSCDAPEQEMGMCRLPDTDFVYDCDWGVPHRFADMGFWRVDGKQQTNKLYLVNAGLMVPSLEDCNEESDDWGTSEGSDHFGRRIGTCLRNVSSRPQVELIDVATAFSGNPEILGPYVQVSERVLFENQFLEASSIHGLPLLGTWYLVFKRETADQLADQLFSASGQEPLYWPSDHCEFRADAPYEHDDFAQQENGFKPFDLDTVAAIDVVLIVGWLPTHRPHYVALEYHTDIIVQAISTDPAQPVPGQPVAVTVTVKNQGSEASGAFWIDWYPHLDAPPSAHLIGTRRKHVSSLTPGATYTMNTNYVYSATGDYYMYAQVDTDDEVAEAIENNNVHGHLAISVKRLTLHDGDSYDFSEYTVGQYTGGDLYLKDLKFYANNVGQQEVVDLADIGTIPLDMVDIPKTGYTRFGVPALKGHTYVSRAQEGEQENYIVFRVH